MFMCHYKGKLVGTEIMEGLQEPRKEYSIAGLDKIGNVVISHTIALSFEFFPGEESS